MPCIDPRQEALDRLGGRYDVRLLEPCAPAVTTPPWYADDPAGRGVCEDDASGDTQRPIVSPVTTGDLLWEDLVRADPALADWCAERWLAAQRPIGQAPADLIATRLALQRLAQHVLAPTRRRAAGGKVGLRWVRGGFGTPFFGNDVQLRVEGDVLSVQVGDDVQRGRALTLSDAAEFVGFDLTRYDLAAADEPLEIVANAARWLGEVLGLATSALEQLRAEAKPDGEPSRVQLWPGHFDLALEHGAEQSDRRATFGMSTGDELHPEPYAFVRPWNARPEGAKWQAKGFVGAELRLAEILDADDQRGALLAFYRDRRDALDT